MSGPDTVTNGPILCRPYHGISYARAAAVATILLFCAALLPVLSTANSRPCVGDTNCRTFAAAGKIGEVSGQIRGRTGVG